MLLRPDRSLQDEVSNMYFQKRTQYLRGGHNIAQKLPKTYESYLTEPKLTTKIYTK